MWNTGAPASGTSHTVTHALLDHPQLVAMVGPAVQALQANRELEGGRLAQSKHWRVAPCPPAALGHALIVLHGEQGRCGARIMISSNAHTLLVGVLSPP